MDGLVECRRRFGMSSTNVGRQLARPFCQLLQNMGLGLTCFLFKLTRGFFKGGSQLGEVLCQFGHGLSSHLLLLHQPVRKRLDFFLDVELKALKPSLEIVAEIRGFTDQMLFELCKPAVMLLGLCAEENVSNLVEIPACGSIIRRWRSTFSVTIRR